jgi:DNA repair exonuclease SbcCD ATPase subunit
MKSASKALIAAIVGMTCVIPTRAQDRTITRVVKLLQDMLDTSKEDGEAAREQYASRKCECDDEISRLRTTMKDSKLQVAMLTNNIQETQADNGVLSQKAAQLQADIEAIDRATSTADSLRATQKSAFEGEEADLTAAIGQLGQAIEVLSTIGADQTALLVAKSRLAPAQRSVAEALVAAQSHLLPAQRSSVKAFLQAPFTGHYEANSGAIMGILKQMKTTFESNLESAKTAESAAVESHAKFLQTKSDEKKILSDELTEKQDLLSNNDADLGTKKEQLTQAKAAYATAETTLGTTEPSCAASAEEYEKFKILRTNEEAAISQAIAILNNDQAFEAFGKVSATSTGATGFLALRTIRRHRGVSASASTTPRLMVQRLLKKASLRFPRIRRVAALLQAGNPFDKVLAEITKIQALIEEESEADSKQLQWCTTETDTSNADLASKVEQLGGLNTAISTITNSIENPVDGLIATISLRESDLQANYDTQKDETDSRREESKVYKKTIADATTAATLLQRAITVLTRYYAAAEEEKDYVGRKDQGKSVIEMLEFIHGETQKEETTAHDNEMQAQKAYEDSMALLKEAESQIQGQLVELKNTLADSKIELESKREQLAIAEKEKVAIERYLESIEPGCTFITTNFDLRKQKRDEETAALSFAVQKLKDTAAYKTAVAASDNAALGNCASSCQGDDRTHVKCEACLAGVSEPGYCAGHPGTPGC